MSYKIEPLPDGYAEIGESPHWDVGTQNLYYVDINSAILLRYNYNENKVYKAKVKDEKLAAFIIPVEGTNDQFAVAAGNRVVVVQWDGISDTAEVLKTLFQIKNEDVHFNDGKCDPCGRLFTGTMLNEGDAFVNRQGEFFKYEKGGKVEILKSNIGISNGLAWNNKANKFYYIDTADYEIKEYNYDLKTGKATQPKVIFNLRKSNPKDPKDHLWPDGMTVDTEGNIYVATFNGHTVFKVNPSTGKVLLEIKFPCKQITATAFGGPNLDILYVTTSSLFGETDPAGTTYKVTGLGAKGFPPNKIQI